MPKCQIKNAKCPNYKSQITISLEYLFATSLPANAPHVVAIRLIGEVRVAVVEVHVPCVGSEARARGGRPIVVADGSREIGCVDARRIG